MNQMTTNAMVVVAIDEGREAARSFATPRHVPHSTKPITRMMTVRMVASGVCEGWR
jgi:hypothetical protein